MIVYSEIGAPPFQEILSAGSMAEALDLFHSNNRMAYKSISKIHAVWVLLNHEGVNNE
jgi:hypothetical protein